MGVIRDLTGQRFGRLVAIQRGEDRYSSGGARIIRWECRCDCRNTVTVDGASLRSGNTKSCGCAALEMLRQSRTHGGTHRGEWDRLYGIYAGIKARCYNQNKHNYARYGGRGVRVCDEWLGKDGYANFKSWAYANGYDENAPKGQCTIERIDVNGNYGPSNCRWATTKEQANNTRANRRLSFCGETHTLAQWSEIVGLDAETIRTRIDRHGWTIEEALTLPKNAKVQKYRVVK